MEGLKILSIGQTGCGKTTLSKNLLNSRPKGMSVKIYDINKEYTEYYNEPFVDYEEFAQELLPLKGHFILIEEATIFFGTNNQDKVMRNLLVRTRHTGNIVLLNFHTWLSVPKNIFNMMNFVNVFKTSDTLMTVKQKYDKPELLKAYQESIDSKDKHFFKTIRLN